jgi:hypothetical protein
MQSYFFCLRLNIKTFFVLLQLLQTELAGSSDSEDAPDVTGKARTNINKKLTIVIRRILPAVRQYSIWLIANAVILTNMDSHNALHIEIKELWSIYASTMTLLVASFPVDQLPSVSYLLEEDADTVGFSPLRDTTYCDLYTTEAGLKPRITDPGVERQHPNIEMHARIRDLLGDAMVIGTCNDKLDQKIAPIVQEGNGFHFLEAGIHIPSPVEDHNPYKENWHREDAPVPSRHSQASRQPQRTGPPSVAASDSHLSMDTDMYRMVDNLVAAPGASAKHQSQVSGSDETSYGMHSSTFEKALTTTLATKAEGDPRPMSRHPSTPYKNIPSVFKNAFSPQPNELFNKSPNLPSSKDMKGDSPWKRSSWEPLQNDSQQTPSRKEVSSQLMESLIQQYGPPGSKFTQSSSLYASTPNNVPRRYGDPSMNDSTRYTGASDFDKSALLQSSLWNGSQPANWGNGDPTPPPGQG